jgi:BppU N-terminal domain
MPSTWNIKRNDTAGKIRTTLTDADGTPADISTGTVQFHMRQRGKRTLKVDAEATVIDGTAGIVEYSWTAQDTDTAGIFDIEWEVTYPDGDNSEQTFPNRGFDRVIIDPDLA